MFKVENLDQINSLTYKPIDRKNKYKYIIINKQYVDKKYEIGKRYKQDITFYNELSGLPSYAISKSENFKIMEIKLFGRTYYDIANDFKIVREINYDEISKMDMLKLKMLSFVKNQTEESFNSLIEEKEKCSKVDKKLINLAIIDAKNYDYINRIKERPKYFKIHLIKKIGRNKDKNVLTEIIKIGRPQDLDILIKSENNWLISKILRHGREKDVNIYIKNFDDTIFQNIIIETGIDKYMDYIIENNLENIHEILLADVGRKKDLDKIIKTKNEYVLSIIMNNQYEEHLHLLSHHYYPDISKLAEETLTECNLKTIWKINI